MLISFDHRFRRMPVRIVLPTETTAMRGATAARNLSVEDVLLPWCGTFRKSDSIAAPSLTMARLGALFDVSGQQKWREPSVSRITSESSFDGFPRPLLSLGRKNVAIDAVPVEAVALLLCARCERRALAPRPADSEPQRVSSSRPIHNSPTRKFSITLRRPSRWSWSRMRQRNHVEPFRSRATRDMATPLLRPRLNPERYPPHALRSGQPSAINQHACGRRETPTKIESPWPTSSTFTSNFPRASFGANGYDATAP